MTINQDQAVKRIQHHLNAGRCVPYIGAGASISAGGPTLRQYIARMLDGLTLPQDVSAELLSSREYNLVASEIARLRSELELPLPEVQLKGPSPIHKLLAGWSAALYVTTNYDDGMEQAIRETKQCRVFKGDQIHEANVLGLAEQARVFKIATTAAHLELTGIIGDTQLADLVFASPVVDFVISIMRTHLLVFIGCSMGDLLTRSILRQANRSAIGCIRPIAVLPSDTDVSILTFLKQEKVDVCLTDGVTKTASLRALLNNVVPVSVGSHHILIFEPGASSKLDQVLTSLRSIGHSNISSITVISEQAAILNMAVAWRNSIPEPINLNTHLISSIENTTEVLELLSANRRDWNCILTPFEYATQAMARFVEAYNKEGFEPQLHSHSEDSVEKSRNKLKFRAFLKDAVGDNALFRHTPFISIDISDGASSSTLLDAIRNSPLAEYPEVVIKPINAAGSMGVRPLSLRPENEGNAIKSLEDFLLVIREMKHQHKTRNCVLSHALVEQRLRGDEFSVEARCSDVEHPAEIICIHWKPGIDDDGLRFFERVYVTVPPDQQVYELLSSATIALLAHIKCGRGVFHAEFRVDGRDVYPLEVAFRPGGGTVSQQVKESHGVDLYESLLQCGLQRTPRPSKFERVVAAAEVFADKPGVVPPLKLNLGEDRLFAIPTARVSEVRGALNEHLKSISREQARVLLTEGLARNATSSEFAQHVIKAFESSTDPLRASVEDFTLWMAPGEEIIEEETAYVAGLRIATGAGVRGMAAVAEALAAMEVCYACITCIPEHPLPRSRNIDSST